MLLTTLAFLALTQTSTKTPSLFPGKPAPDLVVAGWLKSEAPKPQKGHLRVVEFWATWCVPCKMAMPHLSELARKYKDRIDVVGVDVMEPEAVTQAMRKRFVDDMGKDMDYRVAYDTAKGTMRDTWLTAAGLNSIPSTFLIDDTNKILWIGHPDHLQEQLDLAFAGKTDVASNAAAFVLASNWLEGSQAAIAKADEAYKAGRKDEAEKIWNDTLAKWPRSQFMIRKARLETYPLGTPESAAVVDQMLAGNVVERENVVRFAMTLSKDEHARAESYVDRAVSERADETLLYTAAVAYKRLGAYAKAVQTADTALKGIGEHLADPRYAPLKTLIEANQTNFKKVRDEAAAMMQQGQ